MNLSYVGSVAERFMKFRSTLATEENISEELFDAVSIYIPSAVADTQFTEEAKGGASFDLQSGQYAVVAVTVDNYMRLLESTGELYSQWLPVFNDGTNGAITLYCIVFQTGELTDASFTFGKTAVANATLTKAFNDLYFISFFKTMFCPIYTLTNDGTGYQDAAVASVINYYGELLSSLSTLCEGEATLSYCLGYLQITVPEVPLSADNPDPNVCKILSLTRGDETNMITDLTKESYTVSESDTEVTYTRHQMIQGYLWGAVNLIGGTHTMLMVHNGSYMPAIVLGKWFESINSSGLHVGNKLAKIRLSGTRVKPTGRPSPLNTDVNLNLPYQFYENLDAKNVGYFISISGSSMNNAELVRDRSISNFPATAYMISKWIDYNTSQDLANYVAANSTLTDPVLCNEQAYEQIQAMLAGNIQLFTGTQRITDIALNFPPFSQAKKGNSIEGTGVWSAVYVDDLESVEITGTISF